MQGVDDGSGLLYFFFSRVQRMRRRKSDAALDLLKDSTTRKQVKLVAGMKRVEKSSA